MNFLNLHTPLIWSNSNCGSLLTTNGSPVLSINRNFRYILRLVLESLHCKVVCMFHVWAEKWQITFGSIIGLPGGLLIVLQAFILQRFQTVKRINIQYVFEDVISNNCHVTVNFSTCKVSKFYGGTFTKRCKGLNIGLDL